jgi:hypothetical protein
MSGDLSSDDRNSTRPPQELADAPQGSLDVSSAAAATAALTGDHDILQDVDHRAALSTLPDAVRSFIQSAEGLSDDAEVDVYLYPKQMGGILIPSHEWDYSERVNPEEIFNLKEDARLSVMGGPTVSAYSKIDPSQPGWIVFNYLSTHSEYKILKID